MNGEAREKSARRGKSAFGQFFRQRPDLEVLPLRVPRLRKTNELDETPMAPPVLRVHQPGIRVAGWQNA